MCGACNLFDGEEDIRKALAELFGFWKVRISEILDNNEAIRNFDWIEGFFKDIRRYLSELKDRSDYPDLFKAKAPLKTGAEVFEISLSLFNEL